MQVGDRLISKIDFNHFVEKGREYCITRFSNANFHMDIKRVDNKGGTATFLKEFVYDNFDNITNKEKSKMNLIEAIKYLKEDENNRVKDTGQFGDIYKIECDTLKYLSVGLWYKSELCINSSFNFEIYKEPLSFKEAMEYLGGCFVNRSVKQNGDVYKIYYLEYSRVYGLLKNDNEFPLIRISELVDLKFEKVLI